MVFTVRVEQVAAKKGTSMAQVALAWILSRPGVSAPIVGARSLENLKDLISELDFVWSGEITDCGIIDAVDVKLSDEEIKFLEERYQPQAISGHR